MKYLAIFYSLTILFLISCSFQHHQNERSDNWNSLTIICEDHQVININNSDDTSMVKYYDNGSIFEGRHKTKIDSVRAYFTRSEKDSLFKLSKDIIANPVSPSNHCTDFVGDLKLIIYYNESVQQSISYSGVCKWDSLSRQTLLLKKLLQTKIKWVH